MGSGHNETDYNSLRMQFRTIYTVELECILDDLPSQRFALSECSLVLLTVFVLLSIFISSYLQYFDTVGWATGRASGL